MTRIFIALEDALLVLQGQRISWKASEHFVGTSIACIDIDPYKPERLYCGTNNTGLWYSDDAGSAWTLVGKGITHTMVMAIDAEDTDTTLASATVGPIQAHRKQFAESYIVRLFLVGAAGAIMRFQSIMRTRFR